MPANTDAFAASVAALRTQVAKNTSTELSAAEALRGQADLIKRRIEAAILADDAIDNAKIAEFQALVDQTTTELLASDTNLAGAVAENTGGDQPPV